MYQYKRPRITFLDSRKTYHYNDLVNNIAKFTQLTILDTKIILDMLFFIIREQLFLDKEISIDNFGKIYKTKNGDIKIRFYSQFLKKIKNYTINHKPNVPRFLDYMMKNNYIRRKRKRK